MRALLTHVSVRRSGNIARRDEEVDCEAVRVGRSLSNQIVLEGLAVSLQHAEFVARGDGVYLVPMPASTVLLGGRRLAGDVRVAAGDVARIGGYELRVVGLGENDCDLAIDIQHVEESQSGLEALLERSEIQLEHGLWTRRRWSWIVVVSILAATLIIPLATGYRGSWNTGPISNNHAQIANDCATCHSAFQPVKNTACLSCHPRIGSHADERAEFAHLDSLRCASCHLEHGGDDGLAALEDASCGSCHADLDAQHATEVGRASDFAGEHPEFTLHLLTPVPPVDGAPQAPEVKRVAWGPDVKEASGLEFDHFTHVGGVRQADSTRSNLRCDSCHVPDEAGRRMQPVDFEQHCRGCHALNYARGSKNMRQAEAHHGEPGELRRQLQLAFLDDVLLRQPGETERETKRRRLRLTRPGSKRAPEEQQLIDAVNKRADSAFTLLMSDKYCGQCHQLVPEGDPSDVAPVAITQAWFGDTLFDHSSHASTRCGECHPRAAAHSEEAASADGFVRAEGTRPSEVPYGLTPSAELKASGFEPSRHASDVLILGESSCLKCHAGSLARPPDVASPCVMCHIFHHADLEPIASRSHSAP